MLSWRRSLLAAAAMTVVAPVTHAQFAVIDVAAVAQLIDEVAQVEQEVETARNQLSQAQAEYQSITGNRGMERLLAGVNRNYLPKDWPAIQRALQGSGLLASDIGAAIAGDQVLSDPQVAALSPPAAQQIKSQRQTDALLQAISHQGLSNASDRFSDIQKLIDAIGRAADQKAVLDLQARIAAEQGMLQNESSKLQLLFQVAQAQRWVDEQQARERAIAGYGDFSNRFHPTP